MRVEIKADGNRPPYARGELLISGDAVTDIGITRLTNCARRLHWTEVLVYVDSRLHSKDQDGNWVDIDFPTD